MPKLSESLIQLGWLAESVEYDEKLSTVVNSTGKLTEALSRYAAYWGVPVSGVAQHINERC